MNGPADETQVDAFKSPDDACMDFFDTVFNAVPPLYRQIDKEDDSEEELDQKRTKKQKKNGSKASKDGQKSVSLLELNERAQSRIDDIRRANALKSQQRIKELTAEHKKQKAAAAASGSTQAKEDAIMDDEDSSGDEEESKEERKSRPQKNGKAKGDRREPLEGKKGKG